MIEQLGFWALAGILTIVGLMLAVIAIGTCVVVIAALWRNVKEGGANGRRDLPDKRGR